MPGKPEIPGFPSLPSGPGGPVSPLNPVSPFQPGVPETHTTDRVLSLSSNFGNRGRFMLKWQFLLISLSINFQKWFYCIL